MGATKPAAESMSVPTSSSSLPKVVVALCTTAGSPSDLARFLRGLNNQPDTAQILVLQQRDTLDAEALRATLKESGREITAVTDGMDLEGGKIYLPPANVIVTLERGTLRLRPASEPPGEGGTIDSFIISVDEAKGIHKISALFDDRSKRTSEAAAVEGSSALTLAALSKENATALGIIEDQRRSLEHVQESETEVRLLLSELQHRVRNTLSVVRSIARRTAETTESVEDYGAHLDGRLAAFSRVQAMVTRDPAAGVSLEQLVGEEMAAVAAHEDGQLTINGPYLRMKPKGAEIMALAVHELATNALKYGALAVPDGRIDIDWSILDNPGKLRFVWTEAVPGGIKPPRRDGFGTEFINRLMSYELDATPDLQFGPNGVICRIDIPLVNVLAAGEPLKTSADETG